jgi:IS5 family transposase
LEKLSRFGFDLPEQITVHLDAGYDNSKTRDLLTELGCDWIISRKGTPLHTGATGSSNARTPGTTAASRSS